MCFSDETKVGVLTTTPEHNIIHTAVQKHKFLPPSPPCDGGFLYSLAPVASYKQVKYYHPPFPYTSMSNLAPIWI